jgi:excisionase family DNA binding protein
MIMVQGITLDHFFQQLEKRVREKLQEFHPAQKASEGLYLNAGEVAGYLRFSRVTLYNCTRQGPIPSYRWGRKLLYKANEIDQAAIQLKNYRKPL